MKKRLLFLLLVVGLNTGVFSITETWLSLGFEYGNFFEYASSEGVSAKTYMGTPGINLNVYNFWNNKNVDIFVHDFFGFPKKSTIEINLWTVVVTIQRLMGSGTRY